MRGRNRAIAPTAIACVDCATTMSVLLSATPRVVDAMGLPMLAGALL